MTSRLAAAFTVSPYLISPRTLPVMRVGPLLPLLVWRRQYPYAAVGARSVVPFAAMGFAAWWILAVRVWRAPVELGAPLGAIIAGLVAFHVFASEGPQRPPSVPQAATADGVVAGIIAFATTAILLALEGGQAASGWLSGTLSILGCALAGGLLGGLLGWGIALTSSEELLRREPAYQTRRRRRKSGRRKHRR